MRWILAFIFLLVCSNVWATNLTGFWYTDGGNKVARQQSYPKGGCSTCTVTRVWDGVSVNQFSAQGETIGGGLYLLNGSASDATNVMVAVSSLTCAGGTGIVSVAVSSSNVWDTTTRPTQVFLAKYVQVLGISDLPFGHDEFNENYYPPRFRPNGAQLWANRPDHDAFYPHGLVPMEEFAISSFTVAKSSSQLVWIDTYVSTSIPKGTCTGTITVTEGISISTTIAYNIKVYGFKMPTKYSLPIIAYVDDGQVDKRLGNGSLDTSGRNHTSQLLHAHGFSAQMGDSPDVSTNDYPSVQYTHFLDGTIYTAANGYGNARGIGVGQNLYMIGTYNSWSANPNFSQTNATNFCDQISSWSANLASYPNTKAYIYFVDEADSTTLVNSNEKWATWISTKCTMSGTLIHSWVTNPAPTAKTYAPHVTASVSGGNYGFDPNHPYPNEVGYAYTPSTWQTAMNGYLTGGTTEGWRYNAGVLGEGGIFTIEEEGYVPRQHFWANWLLQCAPSPSPGVCKGGWFAWHSNYWNDENNGHNDNDVFNVAKTFGYDTTTSAQWGHNGSSYSQSDGVLLWYGRDTIYANPNYNFDGVIATYPLKMIRRGINDTDVMALASQINLATTTSTVRGLNSVVQWESPCTSGGDCTYNNTDDRGWSYDPDQYTLKIESLYQLVEAAQTSGPSSVLSGSSKLSGGAKLQ